MNSRGLQGLTQMETLIKDIRYGVRSFLKRPGFLFIAISTLALGIGATTAMFTVVNSVLLRPLNFPEPDRIVQFEGINPRQGITQSALSVPDFVDWQTQSQSFEYIAGFVTNGSFLRLNDETELVRTAAVSADFFTIFKTNALSGRTIQADDTNDDADGVVISHALWQRRFGGASDVVGRKIRINSWSGTIIGIMPAGFTFPDD